MAATAALAPRWDAVGSLVFTPRAVFLVRAMRYLPRASAMNQWVLELKRESHPKGFRQLQGTLLLPRCVSAIARLFCIYHGQ